MSRRAFIPVAIIAMLCASVSVAQSNDLTRNLSREDAVASAQLQQRVDAAYPAGTPVTVFVAGLQAAGFRTNSERPRWADPMYEGSGWLRRSISGGVLFVCDRAATVQWRQRDGRIYDVEASTYLNCL